MNCPFDFLRQGEKERGGAHGGTAGLPDVDS